MVVIRKARGGNKHRPFYSLVVADSRCRRDGRFIEKIGFENPLAPEGVEAFRINADRLNYWLSVGAQMSPAVQKLVKQLTRKTAAPAA